MSRILVTILIALPCWLYAGDLPANLNNTYTFSATIFHKDTGWKHYVNKWEIIGEDGTIFGTRILQHPHVNEQPFTRSLSSIVIPVSVKIVIIRAHDSVHKYGGEVITLDLP